MKTPLLLIACLATAVVLAGCAGGDDAESTGDNGNQTGRELNTDVMVGEGDGSTNATANETGTTGGSSG